MMIEYTDNQLDYIYSRGGQLDDDGEIIITYKSFRKIPKDYAGRDHVDRARHVWLIPGPLLLIEHKHFTLVKRID